MKLHLKNMISAAGAMDHEIDIVANMVKQSGERITMATVEAAILEIRKK
jgi:hypothetical protein